MRRDRGGTRWEEFFLSFGVVNRATKKTERGIRNQLQAAAISRNNTTTNRKQYQMGRGKDSAAEERLGRTITRCLDGDSSDEK
jgi:hypothetical protein